MLGRIVCVINEEGIYYYHGFIEWKAIERVEYDIESKGRYAPTVTSIYIMGKKREPKIVYNVPYFALRKIKKFKFFSEANRPTYKKFLTGIFFSVKTLFLYHSIAFSKSLMVSISFALIKWNLIGKLGSNN